MHRDRLEHLIATMEDVQRRDLNDGHQHFSMGMWGDGFKGGVVTCSTVACAGGWEATTEYARQRGLHLKVERDGTAIPVYITPNGDRYTEIWALAQYLDIPYTISRHIFFSSYYVPFDKRGRQVTPQNVIDRVKHLLDIGDVEYSKRYRVDNIVSEAEMARAPGGLDYQPEEQS